MPRVWWLLLAIAAAIAARFLAADLLSIACYAAATVLVYDLFAASDRNLSLIAMSFSLLACAAGAVGGVLHLAAFIVFKGAQYLSLLHSLALLFLRLRAEASTLGLALFAIHCLVAGYLIFREALKCKRSY